MLRLTSVLLLLLTFAPVYAEQFSPDLQRSEISFYVPAKITNVRGYFRKYSVRDLVFDEKKGEQPMVVSKEMALSFGDLAGLRKIIEAVEGKKITDAEAVNYDVLTIVGKPLLVTVSHSEPNEQGIVYANATTFSPLIKGLTVDPLSNKTRVLTYENWDEELYNSLPDFLKEKMNKTPEFKNRGNKFEVPTVKVDLGEGEPQFDENGIPF